MTTDYAQQKIAALEEEVDTLRREGYKLAGIVGSIAARLNHLQGVARAVVERGPKHPREDGSGWNAYATVLKELEKALEKRKPDGTASDVTEKRIAAVLHALECSEHLQQE